MSNSKLINYTKISPNRSQRTAAIDTITIHHMAGNFTVEECGNGFAKPERQASSNYGVGSDGRIALYVPEDRRAWSSSNRDNDNRAVTIEVANDGGAPDWHVSDKALEATIALCVDICQRNDIKKLNYTGDTSGNLTRHNMFVATTCPGPYLQGKFPYIVSEVNRRLTGKKKGYYTMEMRNLKKGCMGEDVRAMQILLMGRGYSVGTYGADGVFGDDTKAAVKAYQKAKKFQVDGIAGKITMSSLMGVGT